MAATDMYVLPAGAGLKNGLSWANAFSPTELETDMETLSEPGDRYFVMGGVGDYNIVSNIQALRNGTPVLPICIYGVKPGTTNEPPVESDWAERDNRPYFNMGAAAGIFFRVQHNWDIRNVRLRKSGALINGFAMRLDTGGYVINCKLENITTGIGDSWGLYNKGGSGGTTIIDCELVCTNGYAASLEGSKVYASYAHDSRVGYQIDGGYNFVISCIANNMTESGIYIPESSYALFLGNTLNNCFRGIDNETVVTGYCSIMNNCLSNCTTGIHFDSAVLGNFVDWNNYWNNGTDVNNVVKGPNAMAVDPQYINAVGGDLSLNTASALIRAGFGIRLGVGV